MAYWKNIIGFPEYEIDTLGRVWSWHTCLLCVGEKHGNAKLTEQDVRMIVYMYGTEQITQQKIADIYHVTNSLISGIINKKSWKHIWSK